MFTKVVTNYYLLIYLFTFDLSTVHKVSLKPPWISCTLLAELYTMTRSTSRAKTLSSRSITIQCTILLNCMLSPPLSRGFLGYHSIMASVYWTTAPTTCNYVTHVHTLIFARGCLYFAVRAVDGLVAVRFPRSHILHSLGGSVTIELWLSVRYFQFYMINIHTICD